MPGFLPEYPFAANPLLLFGFLLLAGVIGGEVVQRVLAVPQIVGYVLIGLLLGAGGLGVLDTGLVKEAWTFVELALGLILFELGRRLDITWLRRDAWLAATAVLESALTFWLLFLVLTLLGVGPLHAAVAAAIGISTSPAVVLVVAQDLRAEGQVTERALLLAAINSVISFVVVTIRARLVGFNRSLEEAGMDLYADGWTTFRKVTLPIIFPGILAAGLLAFALSIDDYVITLFSAGRTLTFPLWVVGVSRLGIPPEVNVLGTLILLVAFLLIAVQTWSARRSGRRQEGPVTLVGR